MRRTKVGIAGLLAISLGMFVTPAKAVMIRMMDDFEDGTVMNWKGHSPSIINIPGGGPGGAEDNFLQVSSTGIGGPGSRMIIFNDEQWAGDYGADGVQAISSDVINLGNNPLDLRIAFSNDDTWYVSTNPFSLSPGSGWQSVVFDLSEVTLLDGTDDIPTTLSNVQTVRILSSQGLPSLGPAGPKGDLVDGVLGLDRPAVPEPSSLVLVALGIAGIRLRRRR